jgi:iron uptake system component EfeO
MHRRHAFAFRSLAFALGGLAFAMTLTGCAKAAKADAAGAPTPVSVVATKDSCTPSPATLPAGQMTFKVSNSNAPAVTEIELQKGGRILGEKENLIPGLSGSFSLRLQAGTYTVYCPGARTDKSPFVVTAAS